MEKDLKTFDLIDKHIFITGASSGIGKQIAIDAAKNGAILTLLGRNSTRLEETYSLLEGSHHNIICSDITNFNDLPNIVNNSILFNDPVNGFVHCAGIEKTLPLKATTPAIFKEIFDINVFAGFEIARLLSKKGNFSEKGSSFVFMSSIVAKSGELGKVAYSASKAAILAGVKSIAIELAPKGIRCNTILPGVVQTELIENLFNSIPESSKEKIIAKHPLGIGKTEDIANIVCFLLEQKNSWITGSEFVIDGGYSLT